MALAILLVAFGDSGALNQPDPLLFLKNRIILFLFAAIGIALSAFLLAGKNTWMKLALIAWMATNFIGYGLAIWWTNGPNIYSCLGNLTDALPIRPRTLNLIIIMLLGYQFLGACAFLALSWILSWSNRRKSIGA